MSGQIKPSLNIFFFVFSTLGTLSFLYYRSAWYSNIPEEIMLWQHIFESAISQVLFYLLETITLLILIAEIVLLIMRKIDMRRFMILLVAPPILAWFISLFLFPLLTALLINHPKP